MERSSPLAALQPQSLPFGHWGGRLEASNPNPHYGGGMGFGMNNFNFKDLSMNRSRTDYFSLKPVRGSSPTSCLTADLSQNFHIDKSPQLATPRRSLFTSNLFGSLNGREDLKTPPLPLSSPCPDFMDTSPLPHKTPYLSSTQITIQSPTPEPTPSSESMLSSPCMELESPLEAMKAPPAVPRLSNLRPAFPRTKGHSTNAVSLKSTGTENHIPPFKFGNVVASAAASLLSFDECFTESPQQTLFSPTAVSMMAPPRPKTAFPNSGCPRNTGSPFSGPGPIRKSSAPTQRPRKQFRRSLSMFEHPGDVMKQQQEEPRAPCGLQSVMDVDDNAPLQLPHFFKDDESIPRITKRTMIDLLDGKYKECYDKSMVVDCRFEYEYKGGHIAGAVNFNDKEELASQLFGCLTPQKTILVFHCEYSAHRAPIAAKYIRHEDRQANVHQYPRLTYPEVYILDGGYSAFFKEHRIRCFPQNYVEMNAKEHENACERGLGRIKQQRAKLGRAQTFAFGQQQQYNTLNDSPTAPNLGCSDLMMGMDISTNPTFDFRRNHAKRSSSY